MLTTKCIVLIVAIALLSSVEMFPLDDTMNKGVKVQSELIRRVKRTAMKGKQCPSGKVWMETVERCLPCS